MSLHLIPSRQQELHQTAPDCPCRPVRRRVHHQGRTRWALVHHDHPGRGGTARQAT